LSVEPVPSQNQKHTTETQSHGENTQAEVFYAAVYRRIVRNMVVLFLLATPVLWVRYNRILALSFAAGCAVAALNFYWLKLTLTAMADRVTSTGHKQSAAGVIARFLLRYVLIAAAVYVIFKGSASSVYGLFAGLFLPVGAIFIEAVYATFGGLRGNSKFQE
jgi:glucan phosphoethanolaminetransferase (alkaline phosphatase superfamily)